MNNLVVFVLIQRKTHLGKQIVLGHVLVAKLFLENEQIRSTLKQRIIIFSVETMNVIF